MAYYLVRAKPRPGLMEKLGKLLEQRAFEGLHPFGMALSAGLCGARLDPAGVALWEEEDYCSPPLAQERAAVLDEYFDDIEVEVVQQGEGWRRIEELPRLFPDLPPTSD